MELNEYRAAMDGVKLSESRRAAILAAEVPQKRARRRPRWPVLLAAALAAALLTVGAVAIGGGQDIGGWFADYWERVNGAPMNEGQSAVIDHLKQHIGQSRTVDGVTVTVDSAAVGDDNFMLLVKAEGVKFNRRFSAGFGDLDMEISPDPVGEGGGMGGWGFQFQGLDEHGAALFLLDQSSAGHRGFAASAEPLTVRLTLTDLTQGPGKGEKTLAEGVWEFEFELDRSTPLEVLCIDEAEVVTRDHENRKRTLTATMIEVTSMGVRFHIPVEDYGVELRPAIVLKNGTEVYHSGGVGTPLEDETAMFYSYRWDVPVDLSQAVALKLGENSIPIEAK